MIPPYEVIEISIATSAVRVIGRAKTREDAEADWHARAPHPGHVYAVRPRRTDGGELETPRKPTARLAGLAEARIAR